MTHHFGVLIPSTNTTVEAELARLPAGYQAHFARLFTSTPGHPFAPSRDEDIDYQSKLLGTAKVEMMILIQTSASLFADDYDEATTKRMSAAAGGVPAITSAHAMARALRALAQSASASFRRTRRRSTRGRAATSPAGTGSRSRCSKALRPVIRTP